jgi:hypothetical protein
VGRSVSVSGEAVGVGELGRERVDFRHVRRPGVGCPGGDRRREPYDDAAPVARVGVAPDVPGALEAVDEAGDAAR